MRLESNSGRAYFSIFFLGSMTLFLVSISVGVRLCYVSIDDNVCISVSVSVSVNVYQCQLARISVGLSCFAQFVFV